MARQLITKHPLPPTPFTRFPNWLITCMRNMDDDMFKVVTTVVRLTCGYHRDKHPITDKEMTDWTGMKPARFRLAVQEAVRAGYITYSSGVYAVAPHPDWALPYPEYLKTPHWQEVKRKAIERAGKRCKICNKQAPLAVHHRDYTRLGNEDPEDVIALCASCHSLYHASLPPKPK